MENNEYLGGYIAKLNHPLKEIRERALQLLVNKLRLGWELEDELSGTRKLLESLLSWFQSSQPTLQKEALQLLLTSIKTKSGTYIVREFGVRQIILDLESVRAKIPPDALDLYGEVISTLQFLNTLESEENVMVPRLTIPDITSSESENGSHSGYYNLDPIAETSKESSISNGDYDHSKNQSVKPPDGIRVLLFPWVELCQSDSKTMILIEDALRLLKSTRRCCRFICDVFLRDFPAEIFLNRPGIITNLIAISEGNNGKWPVEALRVLLCITHALRNRLLQLSSLDLIHESHKISDDYKDIEEGLINDLDLSSKEVDQYVKEDCLAALNQMPAPTYALVTLHSVLSMMARSVVLVDPADNVEIIDQKQLNLCLCLAETLVEFLLDCVTDKFWSSDHNYKTHRDIAHKSCMVMRVLGDLLMKYRISFYEDPTRAHHRVSWLRLLSCAERLLYWARDSALPPSSIVGALQIAKIDPVLDIFYPDLTLKISTVLQSTRTSTDHEYKAKYKQLKKICSSMEEAVKFMKNRKSCRNNKNVYTCIKNSISILEIFQNESFLTDIAEYLLFKTKNFDLDEADWSLVRSICLSLMASNMEWVSAKFYMMLADMVKAMLMSDEVYQKENEKCLTLMCDVSILTEICCHGLSSKCKEVQESCSSIMLYLVRGRLVLSDGCWWRLLASLLPVFPLLHVYAAHDTELGQAICKSLERDIADCMGVSTTDIIFGLVRLSFVRCMAVQLDATHALCKMMDDERYLPPRESLRADILLNALKRVEPQEFNIDPSSLSSKVTMTTGLTQMLDVLKQDIFLDEHDNEYVTSSGIHPMLEPSLRRNTLQQLSVLMRQQELHEMFLKCDGLKIVVTILRMSLLVDDYLAFPECAISCVAIINSVSFVSRHSLAKISDLPTLLIRVILVFPANDAAVLMSAQVLALLVWSGFTLQELDASRQRVPALPLSVTQRTNLPFQANSYWKTSPNAEHSYVEWLLASEEWRSCIRMVWWCCEGGPRAALQGAPPPPAPLALRASTRDRDVLRAASVPYSCGRALLALENAASHTQVIDALTLLECYTFLIPISSATGVDLKSLPWQHTKRFFNAAPASSRDANLLVTLLQFIIAYMDNVSPEGDSMAWIKSSFIGEDASIITLLSRPLTYPQLSQENIDVTQVHTHILKVLLRCIIMLDRDRDYSESRMESLIKILLSCLEKVDLNNFHMLGYLNELIRCIRYALNSSYCRLSEDTAIESLRIITKTLTGCASGSGRKGQACRLDAMLAVLALLSHMQEEGIPVQRWSEVFSNDVIHSIVKCVKAPRVELRAASLHTISALACYAQLLPHLLQGIEAQSLSEFAVLIFARRNEANVVRSAAASLLASVASRATPKSNALENELLEQLEDNNFIGNVLDILVGFCDRTEYEQTFEPNVPLSVLERRSELEVRSHKSSDVRVSPLPAKFFGPPPPTASLVVSVADALNNLSFFAKCPTQQWNNQGLYRVLFKCASWSTAVDTDDYCVRAAVCRALFAVSSHKCVRVALAATKDCLHHLLDTLTPLDKEIPRSVYYSSKAQAMLLLSSLLVEPAAVETVWSYLKDNNSLLYLILQCLETDDEELQEAALYCLTKLTQSASKKKTSELTESKSHTKLYDSIKSPFDDPTNNRFRFCSGDNRNNECHPEYMSEEICKALLNLYHTISIENKEFVASLETRWSRVVSCLCSVIACSGRSRAYCVHAGLSRPVTVAIQKVRDLLSVRVRPNDVLKNADNNPILNALYWLLTLIDCSIVDCMPAKEAFVEENLAISLNRLWTWCMVTDRMRIAVMQLLYNFTNECPKAWGVMCVCVAGQSLMGEICALCVREAALQASVRPHTLLVLTLNTIRHCLSHHHCRAILLKSAVFSSMFKLSNRVRVRAPCAWYAGWVRACSAAARWPEAGAEVLRAAAGPGPRRNELLPAIAHAATHHRLMFLQSPDLLDLLTSTLLTGDVADIVSAARAVWALAANNHKAKLQLRSAGVLAAVQTTLQQLHQSPRDASVERALQLLTYTNTVLQTT